MQPIVIPEQKPKVMPEQKPVVKDSKVVSLNPIPVWYPYHLLGFVLYHCYLLYLPLRFGHSPQWDARMFFNAADKKYKDSTLNEPVH